MIKRTNVYPPVVFTGGVVGDFFYDDGLLFGGSGIGFITNADLALHSGKRFKVFRPDHWHEYFPDSLFLSGQKTV